MKEPMRLFERRGWFHAETERGRSRSLRTKNRAEAEAILKEMRRLALKGRLVQLDNYKRISLSDFRKIYLEQGREGISPETIKLDSISLQLFSDVIGGSTQLRSISGSKIEDFRRACRARGVREVSINTYLRHIKASLSWATEQGYISKRPVIKMYRKKKGSDRPRVLEVDEIKNIMANAREIDEGVWRYFHFLLWTGTRRREALTLEWQNVDLKRAECKIVGKGGAVRMVPLLPPVVEMLEPIKRDLGRVFVQYHRDVMTHKFHKIASACNIKARLHDLRHTCATYLLKSGVPLEVVQKILGHESISTTQIYAKVLEEITKKEMMKLKFE